MLRWKEITNSEYSVPEPCISSTKYFIQQVNGFLVIIIVNTYVFILSDDTHPISAVLSSQLSTKKFTSPIPVQLTFDIDKV